MGQGLHLKVQAHEMEEVAGKGITPVANVERVKKQAGKRGHVKLVH